MLPNQLKSPDTQQINKASSIREIQATCVIKKKIILSKCYLII